jgi:hypothetical protein
MSRIFLSYRRDDTSGYAGRLYDRLHQHFGDDVFMDIDQIAPGEDFVEVLERTLSSCEVVVVLIGRQWLTLADAKNNRRLNNPNDFVRLEIETTLQRKIRVIPALVQGATMPDASELPESLASLTRRQAIDIGDANFHHDTGKLIRVLETIVNSSATSQPTDASQIQGSHSSSESKIETPLEIQKTLTIKPFNTASKFEKFFYTKIISWVFGRYSFITFLLLGFGLFYLADLAYVNDDLKLFGDLPLISIIEICIFLIFILSIIADPLIKKKIYIPILIIFLGASLYITAEAFDDFNDWFCIALWLWVTLVLSIIKVVYELKVKSPR